MKHLIKAPRDKNELIAALPFLSEIARLYPEDEVSIIYDDVNADKIDFLKNDLKTFILPEKNNTLMGVHKYSVNENNLFNIDIFFDLEGSLNSAYLGFCFKAQRRFGFRSGLRSLFYTDKIDKIPNQSLDQQLMNLLQKFTEIKDRGASPRGHVIELRRLFQTGVPEDFILVLLDLSREEEEWINLLNSFERQNFLIVEMTNKYKLDDFYQSLSKNNEIVFDKEPSTAKIMGYAQKMKGILTNQTWLGWALRWQGAAHVMVINNETPLNFPLMEESPEHYSYTQDLGKLVDSIHAKLKL